MPQVTSHGSALAIVAFLAGAQVSRTCAYSSSASAERTFTSGSSVRKLCGLGNTHRKFRRRASWSSNRSTTLSEDGGMLSTGRFGMSMPSIVHLQQKHTNRIADVKHLTCTSNTQSQKNEMSDVRVGNQREKQGVVNGLVVAKSRCIVNLAASSAQILRTLSTFGFSKKKTKKIKTETFESSSRPLTSMSHGSPLLSTMTSIPNN